MFNLSFIYFDFLHHLLSEIKEKKLYVFLQHFVYQQYIEVKDAANWMLCVHWKVCLNIAHNDWTINFAVPFPQYWHSKCNRFTAVAFLQFTCQLFNVNIISSLQYLSLGQHSCNFFNEYRTSSLQYLLLSNNTDIQNAIDLQL